MQTEVIRLYMTCDNCQDADGEYCNREDAYDDGWQFEGDEGATYPGDLCQSCKIAWATTQRETPRLAWSGERWY